MIFAGLDIGTSGAKLNVFDNGLFCESFSCPYPTRRGNEENTIEAADLRQALFAVLEQAGRHYPSLMAIGISSFGESFVILDEKDQPLFPILLYGDSRGQREAKELEKKIRVKDFVRITAHHPEGTFSLPKILYFRKQNPALFAQAKKIMLMEDYAVYLYSGIRQIDYSLASRTLAFDVFQLEWSPWILAKAKLSSALFSRPVPPGTIAGPLRKDLAAHYGLSSSLLIVNGAHDQVAAAIGAGVLHPGEAVDGLGTCECLTPLFESGAKPALLVKHNYGIVPYLKPKQKVTYSLLNTSGALFEWYFRTFFQNDSRSFSEKIADLNAHLTPVPSPVLLFPDFAGSATPHCDPFVRGAILGLSLGSTRETIYQALLEGLAFASRYSLEALEKDGVAVTKIFVAGGGTANEPWLQMKADVLGREIIPLANPQAGAIGSALLAGLALGCFPSLEAGLTAMRPLKPPLQPELKRQALYEIAYRRFCRVYPTLSLVKERSS